MSAHLTNEQVSRAVLEGAEAELRPHLSECSECRAQVEAFDRALSGFRGSVRHWSRTELNHRAPVLPVPRPAFPNARLVFTLICLAVLVVMHPWSRDATTSAAVTPTFISPVSVSPASVSDDALLRQVSADVVRVTPSGMESLAPVAFE